MDSRSLWRSGCASVGVVVALACSGAEAAPSKTVVELRYERRDGAEVCPDEHAFRDSLAAQLGRDPVAPAAPTRLIIKLSREPRGFVAELARVGADGSTVAEHQPMRALDCAELVEQLALWARLELEPVGAVKAPARTGPTAPDARANGLRFGGGLAFAMVSGVVPHPAPRLAAGAEALLPAGSLALQLRWTTPTGLCAKGTDCPSDVPPSWREHATVVTGALVLCWRARWLLACGQGEVGVHYAWLSGPTTGSPRAEETVYGAGGARFGVHKRFFDRVDVRVVGDLVVQRPVALAFQGQRLWSPLPVATAVGVDVAFF